jgi:hypothetical protein
MAEIDRAVAQEIIDKRLLVEESHFSQRMKRQEQLLEISETRVRQLEAEVQSLMQRLAVADTQRIKYEEEASLQQMTLQRMCEELSDSKARLVETRDAAAVEVASTNARHARDMLEQQRAAVESARSFKALLQQRDAKITELSRLVNVLTPSKVRIRLFNVFLIFRCRDYSLQPQDFLMAPTRQVPHARPTSQPQAVSAHLYEASLRGTAPV